MTSTAILKHNEPLILIVSSTFYPFQLADFLYSLFDCCKKFYIVFS